MKQFSRRLARIGLEEWIVLILSGIAIGFAIISFIGGNQISQSILVGVLGLLVLEIVLQHTRLDSTKDEIINSLKGMHLEAFSNDKDFADAKYRQLLMTEQYVYDTELCQPVYIPTTDNPFRTLLNKKIVEENITYKVIQVIYDHARFEYLLKRLFQFDKYNYYIGYFIGPSEVIPVINLMIFDNKHFIIGGYYGPSARGNDRNLYVKHDLFAQTLLHYFDYLWSKAHLFNEHKSINWDEIKSCGLRLGYSLDELNTTIARIAQEVGFAEVRVLQP